MSTQNLPQATIIRIFLRVCICVYVCVCVLHFQNSPRFLLDLLCLLFRRMRRHTKDNWCFGVNSQLFPALCWFAMRQSMWGQIYIPAPNMEGVILFPVLYCSQCYIVPSVIQFPLLYCTQCSLPPPYADVIEQSSQQADIDISVNFQETEFKLLGL